MTGATRPTAEHVVALGDVDAAGVLYFANVFRWHEAVFSNWLREVGWSLSRLFSEGLGVPVTSASSSYPASAKLDETLHGQLSGRIVDATSFEFQSRWISRESSRVVAEITTVHVACRSGEDGYFLRTETWPGLTGLLQNLTALSPAT